MLPVKLKMQAFASYVNAAEIDFEDLDSLFLIHGETGAGKTAVLDGIMYALYGESSGGERTEMRCALPSAENIPTEVEFIFRARGGLYKFTRSIIITPRSKKLDQRQDCFYFDSESGQYRAFFENPKQAFVRQKAEELTGLTAEQFRQVIILPQGRFERLLTSGSAEKEAILSTLFGAEKYTKLSDRLSEKAEAYRKDIAAENAAMKAMLAAENAESPEQLSEEADRLKTEAEALSPQLSDSKKALAETREKLTAAELLAAKFSSLAEAEKRLSVLDSSREKIEEMRRLLSINETALKAGPEFTAAASASEAFKMRSEQLSAAEKNFADAEAELADVLKKSEAIKQKESEYAKKAEELAVLNRLAPVYEKISLAESTLKKLAAERISIDKACGLTAASLENTSAEIARLSALREKITREFSRRIPSLSARKTALENGAAAEKRLAKFTSALEGIKKKVSTLKIKAEQLKSEKNIAEEKYDRLYGEYLLSTASELSSKLKEGQPCPVCGSLSHPFPAEKNGSSVTAAEVKNARAEFEKAAAALSEKLSEAAAEE
ncbi:MAG: AAA family ATPase, partial [Oscillospiraceae bacterium]